MSFPMTSVPRIWRSTRGTSMIDLMVATVLLSLIMAAGYSSLAVQLRTQATQALTAATMNDLRTGLRVMKEQVAMAGFGVPTATTPSAAPKLITADPAQFSFWTKVNATHTYLTAAAATNATSLTVLSAAGLEAGTSIYVTDNTDWYSGTVQSVAGTTVAISPPLTYDFAAASQVTPVESVTFQLVGSALQRNGKDFIGNVTDLKFTYDADTLSAIRRITITLSGQTRAVDASTGKKISVSVTTKVAPTNLSL
jgi:Tfp pilus assembly protein PilW